MPGASRDENEQMNTAIRAAAGRPSAASTPGDDDDDRDLRPLTEEELFPWETPADLLNAEIRRAAGK